MTPGDVVGVGDRGSSVAVVGVVNGRIMASISVGVIMAERASGRRRGGIDGTSMRPALGDVEQRVGAVVHELGAEAGAVGVDPVGEGGEAGDEAVVGDARSGRARRRPRG